MTHDMDKFAGISGGMRGSTGRSPERGAALHLRRMMVLEMLFRLEPSHKLCDDYMS